MFCDEYFLLRRQNRRDLRALADGDREVLRGIARELPGVLEARDMTPEAVVTKLMWVLAQTRDPAAARALFEQPVQHDLL